MYLSGPISDPFVSLLCHPLQSQKAVIQTILQCGAHDPLYITQPDLHAHNHIPTVSSHHWHHHHHHHHHHHCCTSTGLFSCTGWMKSMDSPSAEDIPRASGLTVAYRIQHKQWLCEPKCTGPFKSTVHHCSLIKTGQCGKVIFFKRRKNFIQMLTGNMIRLVL